MLNKTKIRTMGKFNRKQKKVLLTGLLIISAAIIIWLFFGGEVFTKTEVLIEKQDEFLGTTYKEWKSQFVLGLDYTLGFAALVTIMTSILTWQLKTKRVEEK